MFLTESILHSFNSFLAKEEEEKRRRRRKKKEKKICKARSGGCGGRKEGRKGAGRTGVLLQKRSEKPTSWRSEVEAANERKSWSTNKSNRCHCNLYANSTTDPVGRTRNDDSDMSDNNGKVSTSERGSAVEVGVGGSDGTTVGSRRRRRRRRKSEKMPKKSWCKKSERERDWEMKIDESDSKEDAFLVSEC